MKFNILLAGCLCLGATSCSESFLDIESKTESTTDTFYKTENDAYRALIGCYDGWARSATNGNVKFYVCSELQGYECFGGTGNGDQRNYAAMDRFDISESPADLNLYDDEWQVYYAGVYRCNELISREEQIQWKEEGSMRDTYMGEVHAIRAQLYFDMTRMWGDVPLFTEPVNENRPVSPAADVFKVIFDDLKYAIEHIPADAYPKADKGSNDGHFTKYAAEALLARAYLFYTGYYGTEPTNVTKAEALAAVEDVIASGEFGLIPEYKNLWPAAAAQIVELNKDGSNIDKLYGTYAGDGNAETIFSIKHVSSVGVNNGWLVMVGLRNLNFAPYSKGWGGMTVNPLFVKEYGIGDARRTASIVDQEAEGITKAADWETHFKDQREYTGYNIKKYMPLCYADGTSASKPDGSGDFQGNQHQDFVLMRYADVLLMAAELGSPNAQKYFNMVRERAYTTDGVLSEYYEELPVTKENIMKERKLEFAFEAVNYWDLLRQGVDYAASQLALEVDVMSGGVADKVVVKAERFKATRGLCQIPYDQIVLSDGVLKQNPGW